jgi:hypothetical protein
MGGLLFWAKRVTGIYLAMDSERDRFGCRGSQRGVRLSYLGHFAVAFSLVGSYLV